MELPNEKLVFGQVETNTRLSHKLLHAFNEDHHTLESHFFCLSCNGISINPLFCIKCGYSYCQLCLLVISESNVKCLCRKSSKGNFQPQLELELLKSKYWAQDQSSLKYLQLSYNEASCDINESRYNFISIDNYNLSCNDKEKYKRNCQKINLHLSKHKPKFYSQLPLKNTRLINFHCAKGYSLKLKGKILCKYDAIFLGVLHLRGIKFVDCLFNLDFSLSFSESIRFNIQRIEAFKISSHKIFWRYYLNNIKSSFIILNAIQFCNKIKCLMLKPIFYESESTIFFPKSYYNFLSTFYVLKKICLKNLIFDDNMNLNSFKSSISLQILLLEECCFYNKTLFYCLLDNIPNLNELRLKVNRIESNSISTNISKENFKLKKTLNFSPILRIGKFKNNCIENSIFQDLIQLGKIKIKFIQIDLLYKSPIPDFINFLKCSNLQFLDIEFLREVEGCKLEEFCNYLINSDFLIGLRLKYMEIDKSRFCILLQAISFSKSIKILSFESFDLSDFSNDLMNLILINQSITTLILYYCKIKIDLNLIEALSKNETLLYLDLAKNEINLEYSLKLSNLNIKGINVENCRIGGENKKLIYQKIPYKEFPEDLLYYDNF